MRKRATPSAEPTIWQAHTTAAPAPVTLHTGCTSTATRSHSYSLRSVSLRAIDLRSACLYLACLGAAAFAIPSHCTAKDYFLTIAGGYAPKGNQASMEANVQFFETLLAERGADDYEHLIFFADGDDPAADVQVAPPALAPDDPTRLLASLFDWELQPIEYRDHELQTIAGSNRPKEVRQGLQQVADRLQTGDRLFVYVTAHGGAAQPKESFDTRIHCWDRQSFRASQFSRWLNDVPNDVPVLMVMAQCYCGGFARTIFEDANLEQPLAQGLRCGFFAQQHNLPAAGCRPDISNDREYSSYFWGAIAGRSRNGAPISDTDRDGDGQVSLAEAHIYAVLASETIDIPLRCSDALLRANQPPTPPEDTESPQPESIAEDQPAAETQLADAPAPSPEQAGPKQAGPKQAGPKQAGPKQAGPKQAGPEHAGPGGNEASDSHTALLATSTNPAEETTSSDAAHPLGDSKPLGDTATTQTSAQTAAFAVPQFDENTTLAKLLEIAPFVEREITLGLAQQLEIQPSNTIADIRGRLHTLSRDRRTERRSERVAAKSLQQLRGELRDEIVATWPECEKVDSLKELEKLGLDLTEIAETMKSWTSFQEFTEYDLTRRNHREEANQAELTQVKVKRLLETIKSIILAHQLPHHADALVVERYQQMLDLERNIL